MSIIGRTAAPLGSFKAWITVNANRSATFSISPAPKKIVSQTATQIVYLISEAGNYTVSATDGTYSRSSTVSITAKKQSEVVTLNLFDLAFTLIAGGKTYNINRSSASSSVSDRYSYSRTGENWQLVIYAGGSVNFSVLTTNVDYCAVGGGGGGGGGSCGGSGYYGSHGYNGGSGGGGYYSEQKNKTLTVSQTYATTIGYGGGGGAAGPDSRGSRGESGSGGGTTSLGSILSASGGNGGGYAYDGGSSPGWDGSGGSLQYCFGDTSLPRVSGGSSAEVYPSYRGAGGGGGSWHMSGQEPYATAGRSGTAGLIVIRNKR